VEDDDDPDLRRMVMVGKAHEYAMPADSRSGGTAWVEVVAMSNARPDEVLMPV
jgi:hypothetical protein